MPVVPSVVVALHAHPDDETLLTGGTLARLASEGHRVVLIVATDGARGLSDTGVADLAVRRGAELDAAAAVLGVARVVRLGYRDSGDAGAEPDGFCHQDPAAVAACVAAVVLEEHASLLVGYDEHGGYGHPDHVQVHAVARLVAAQTGTRLLMATVDSRWLERGLSVAARCGVLPAGAETKSGNRRYATRGEITHRVRFHRLNRTKRRALACHVSQTVGGGSMRTVRLLSRLPMPLFAVVAGTEWYIEAGAVASGRPIGDPLVPATGNAS